jgi:translation initiation factor 4A
MIKIMDEKHCHSPMTDPETLSSTGGETVDHPPSLCTSFDAMNLHTDILRGIYSFGFETPSVIQQQAILPISQGHDVIAQAQSGTGKTGSFVVGMLQRMVSSPPSQGKIAKLPRALIMAPTREIALQTGKVTEGIAKYLQLRQRVCVGGTSVREDIQAFERGIDIVIGTPGRIIDLLRRGTLCTESLGVFILDEADEMLKQTHARGGCGFQEDIRTIFEFLPTTVQVVVVSATLPPEILEVTTKFMRDPIRILVNAEELTLEGITQFYVDCDQEEYKYPVLKELYEKLSVNQSIIFCNSKKRVDRLRQDMERDMFTVSSMHGDMSYRERKEIMEEFRAGSARVLITTDLLARGIDVQQVSVVINYDLPHDKSTYLHKAGRSGRFGRKGLVINLITHRDKSNLQELERYYNIYIDPMPENVEDYI